MKYRTFSLPKLIITQNYVRISSFYLNAGRKWSTVRWNGIKICWIESMNVLMSKWNTIWSRRIEYTLRSVCILFWFPIQNSWCNRKRNFFSFNLIRKSTNPLIPYFSSSILRYHTNAMDCLNHWKIERCMSHSYRFWSWESGFSCYCYCSYNCDRFIVQVTFVQ